MTRLPILRLERDEGRHVRRIPSRIPILGAWQRARIQRLEEAERERRARLGLVEPDDEDDRGRVP